MLLRDAVEIVDFEAEEYGILPGHPRYEKAMATWKELQRSKS